MRALNELRNDDHEYLIVILTSVQEHFMPQWWFDKYVIMGEWATNSLRRWHQAPVSRLSPHKEPARQTVLVDQNTAIADTHKKEQLIKLEEEDTEETLDILDTPDAPATPNTPITTALLNTPNSDNSEISDISAGIRQSQESLLDHKAYEARRTNRTMPPKEGLERPRSMIEWLGWVKVAASEDEMKSGIDGNMARHE